MRKILLASALALALAVGAPAIGSASVIFNVNQTIGAGGVTGTITTDGTLGALGSTNLLGWSLTLNDGAAPRAEPIRTRPCPPSGNPWTVAVSRSHGDARTEAFIAERPGAMRSELGSAVKFGRVAEGGVDIYPRLSPTCEWDVAAGHAVVTAAGGKITDSKGAALHFGAGRADFIVPEFIAWGDPSAAS